MNIDNRIIALLKILIRFVMLKDQVELIGSIYLAGDAVKASRDHIAGFGIIVNLIATICVKVFYDIYDTFRIIQ